MGTTGEVLAAGNEAMVEAAFRTGDYDEAERAFQGLLSRARADGDRALEAAVLDRLGMLMHFQALEGDPTLADSDGEEALFRQALTIRRELGDQAGIAESLFGLGLVHQVLRNDWDAAMPCFTEALDLADAHGDLLLRSEVHRHVGFYYYANSDLHSDKALEHLRISHELRAQLGDPRWIPGGTMALGLAELADGLREQGLARVREAIAQAHAADLAPKRTAWMESFLRDAEAEAAR
jgi:tetratricopeptide (TPR) repeat protein